MQRSQNPPLAEAKNELKLPAADDQLQGFASLEHELTDILIRLEEAHTHSNAKLKAQAFKRLAEIPVDCKSFKNSDEFKEQLAYFATLRIAHLSMEEAFLMAAMHYIGLNIPGLIFEKDLKKAHDYLNYVIERTNLPEPKAPHLGALFYMARIHFDVAPSRSKNNEEEIAHYLSRADSIIDYFERAAEKIPSAHTFLGMFYEKLASLDTSSQEEALINANKRYELGNQQGCHLAKYCLKLLVEDGGLYNNPVALKR